ncbi:MAG TPA: hypothetical protein VMC41_00760, partial [Candidatus Nanoarchaeia archaeon]|nr:hypothetical protein [Candidatus Nanoarchaeia archaeon]
NCLANDGASNLEIADVIKFAINHYVDEKNADYVIQLYEQLVQYENNAQYYLALAKLYQQKGEIDKAIAALQQAEKIDPTLKADADAYINKLRNQR